MQFDLYRVRRAIVCSNIKCRRELPSGTRIITATFERKGMLIKSSFCEKCGIAHVQSIKETVEKFLNKVAGAIQ